MRIAFTNIGAAGHVNPTLSVVTSLKNRGAEIYYFTTEPYRQRVIEAGALFEPYESGFGTVPFSRKEDGFDLSDFPVRLAKEVKLALPQLLPRLDALKPDLVVYDALCHAGRLAARQLNLASARICPVLPSNDHWSVMKALELPDTFANPENRNRALSTLLPVLKSLGFSSVPPQELFSFQSPCNVILLAREFHPAGVTFDETFHFVGPCLRTKETKNQEAAAWAKGGLLISLGTVFNDWPEFYEMCFEAFGDTHYPVVLSTGGSKRDFSHAPKNFLTRPSVPQLAVLSGAKAFLTHGGINSLMEAAEFAVPVVVLPQMPEQKANALRVESLGMGVRLETKGVTAAALRNAVEKVMASPEYSQRSAAIGHAGRSSGGPDVASKLLCDYALAHSKQ